MKNLTTTYISTVLYIYDCLYPSETREALTPGVPITKNDTAKIAWIILGVTVPLSALVVGIIVYRKRAKRSKRYFINMLFSI